MADHGYPRALRVFILSEYTSEQRLYAKDSPQIRGDFTARQFFWIAVARDRQISGLGCRNVGENGVVEPPLMPFGGRGKELRFSDLACVVPDHNEAAGVEIGQGTNNTRIDVAKSCGIGSDPERERDAGHRAEARVLPHHSQ